MKKVCSNNAIWIFALILIIPGSGLHAEDPPSTQDQAALEGQPASTAPVPPALRQALASSLDEAVSFGAKAIPAPPTGSWGIVSEGDGGGGIFRDSDSEAEAWLGSAGYGVRGFGSTGGAYFMSTVNSGSAYAGYGDYGIYAQGNTAGGYFKDGDHTGYSYVGYGNYGIYGSGTYSGGYFRDTDSTGHAYVGFGDRGIQSYGSNAGGAFFNTIGSGHATLGFGDYGIRAFGNEMGGYFIDDNSSGYAYVAFGDRGIEAYGNTMGGYFKDLNGSGYANVGEGDYGIRAYGNTGGGRFTDLNSSSYAYVGYQGYGVQAHGSDMGGYFKDIFDSGVARAGYGDVGIQAYGNTRGGEFYDLNSSGYAYVGYSNYGIYAAGSYAGGYFNDTDAAAWARVGHGSYKIFGVGTVSFVQNHPSDSSSVIVYAAPEGDEVATYTRGTARLFEGEVTVPLGETFKWVTNPDLGLTAFLTPVSDWCDLYVAEQATDSIVVRSRDGSDCGFNYMVYGLRIGFEESSIVQEKEMESYIPSMADHRKLYERRPDLKTYNSLERFKGMHHAINPKAKLDLSRAQALRDAIVEFDPAVHELPMPPGHEEMRVDDLALEEAQRGEVQRVRAARGDQDRRLATDHSVLNDTIPVDDEGNVYAPSFRPSSQDMASLVDVSEEVQPGDVLVIDRDNPGMMRKAFEAHDNGVIGVVAWDAGLVAGTQPPAPEVIEEGIAPSHRAAIGVAGVVTCNVDAAYGAVWPGDLLVTSPTPGHAMRANAPLPGTTLGKALEPLKEGAGTIKVMVMLR